MKNIIATLKERSNKRTKALISIIEMPDFYWIGLGEYAVHEIKPAFNIITDIEGLYEFVQYFMVVYGETDCQTTKNAIRAVVFPIYEALGGREFNTKTEI